MNKRIGFTIIGLVLVALVLAACATSQPTATTTAAASTQSTAGCLGDPAKMVADLKCAKVTIAVENAYLPFNYIVVSTNQPGGWDYASLG